MELVIKAAALVILLSVVDASSVSAEMKLANIFRHTHAAPKESPTPTPNPNTLAGVFGSLNQIGDIVKAFDFSKLSSDSGLFVILAPSFGSLDKDSVKTLEMPLKVSIAGTTIILSKMAPQKRVWDNVLSALMQNPLLKPMEESEIRRSDKLTKESTSWFHGTSSTKKTVTSEVFEWFKQVIDDEEIIESTNMDVDFMGKLVSHVATKMDDIWTIIPKASYEQRNVIDVAVLRYPDSDNQFFKLYRVKLDAWADDRVTAVHKQSDNGLTGEFMAHKFKPRNEVISKMHTDKISFAIKIAENIFN